MVATHIKKIMHNMICMTGACSREVLTCFLLVKCLGLSKTLTVRFTQTLYVINANLYGTTLLLTELDLSILLPVTLAIFQGHSSVKQF